MPQDMEWAAERLAVLSRHLKDAGEGGLRRDLNRAISDATGPVLADIRAGLPAHLPNPYAAVLDEDLALGVSRLTGPNPGVRVRATSRGKQRKLRRLEGGVLAHPRFGDRQHWYYQTSHVVRGFFSGPIERRAPKVRAAIIAAVDETFAKVKGR